jgi:hypothetical protein
MEELENIKQEIEQIKFRNHRVEADKAWETSWTRKISIAVLTYSAIVLFFFFAEMPQPFVNAIVPTLGFLLSTLSISVLKKFWISSYKK